MGVALKLIERNVARLKLPSGTEVVRCPLSGRCFLRPSSFGGGGLFWQIGARRGPVVASLTDRHALVATAAERLTLDATRHHAVSTCKAGSIQCRMPNCSGDDDQLYAQPSTTAVSSSSACDSDGECCFVLIRRTSISHLSPSTKYSRRASENTALSS